jgi:hypothetical protein
MTAFVGRERELDELRSLFRGGKRLVTLVGVGGIGKSRLALELGADTTQARLGRTGEARAALAALDDDRACAGQGHPAERRPPSRLRITGIR